MCGWTFNGERWAVPVLDFIAFLVMGILVDKLLFACLENLIGSQWALFIVFLPPTSPRSSPISPIITTFLSSLHPPLTSPRNPNPSNSSSPLKVLHQRPSFQTSWRPGHSGHRPPSSPQSHHASPQSGGPSPLQNTRVPASILGKMSTNSHLVGEESFGAFLDTF